MQAIAGAEKKFVEERVSQRSHYDRPPPAPTTQTAPNTY